MPRIQHTLANLPLADYIATDRSAMMRELKRLREEGLLRSDGRRFTLLV